jgi:alpha-1,2-rhamnosyltransferase
MRYFLECTHTHKTQLRTGIQRVVRNLVRHSAADPQVTPVVLQGPRLIALTGECILPDAPLPEIAHSAILQAARRAYAGARACASLLLPLPAVRRFLYAPRHEIGLSWMLTRAAAACLPRARKEMEEPEGLTPDPGDVLLLIDSSWHERPWAAARAFKAQGGRIVCMIYDLIPETNPEFCDERLRDLFKDWITNAIETADAFVCISQSTASAMRARLRKAGKSQKVTHFWLGSDIEAKSTDDSTSIAALETKDPVFACVGTIEPRKNQTYALDAFEIAWRWGVRAKLVFVGRIGWMSKQLVERIQNHERYGSDLFLLTDADDATLTRIYRRANALIFPSLIEGFGLPLVEAMKQGAPVIASDIPIFREIARDGVTFVALDDPVHCAHAVRDHCVAGAKRLSAPVTWLTWAQSTRAFYEAVETSLTKDCR